MSGNAFDQDDWADVERALYRRSGPEPSDALRNRVLDDVRRVLSEPAARAEWRWTAGARWAAVAAVLIVGMVLSQMAASVTRFFDRPLPSARVASVRAAADLMRQVSPGLTADEAHRLALACASPGDLPAVPIANADTNLGERAGDLNSHGDVR